MFRELETCWGMCSCTDRVTELARDHAGRLAALARGEGLSPAESLDAVQDAFHTLLVRPDLRDRADVDRVLATIVRNAARNLRRRHHRARPHVDADDAQLPIDAAAPDAALAAAETRAQLASCMAGLAEVQRHVVTLRVLEELSGDEAARELGLSAGHVAVLLHRARKQLHDCMLLTGT